MTAWLYSPLPRARVAVLRVVAFLFLPVDVVLTTRWVERHADVPAALYMPVRLGRLLPLPTPGAWVAGLKWFLVAFSLLAAYATVRDRCPRLAGFTVALLYLQWMVVAMSFGKVDHDRFAFLLMLFVLPTVGSARLDDDRSDEAAGWALRMIGIGVVATYMLAAVAKIRFGGWDWVSGATFTRAIVRRGTFLADPLLDAPWVLRMSQWGLMIIEVVVAPLLLVPWRDARMRWTLPMVFLAFHVVTFAMIKISFLPHCVALLALFPLERFRLASSRIGVPASAA